MTVITRPTESEATTALRGELQGRIGRYRDKSFDFDAFPSNRGYPLLERGQMRFVGAGGSPKVGDPGTFPPVHFTVSLIHQQPGRFAAAHTHEVEEAFLVFDNVLTVGWEVDGEVVEVRLGPKDLILNAPNVAHGFRNDDVLPVLLSVMVQHGKPLPPVYRAHPKDVDPELAFSFGVTTDKVSRLDPTSDHPLHKLMARHVVRYNDAPRVTEAGFTRAIYVGRGSIHSEHNRKELVTLPPGAGIAAYTRDVEDAYFVMDGTLTVGRVKDGVTVEERIGAHDLALNAAGTARYFRNEGAEAVSFMMVIGGTEPDAFTYQAA